MDVKGRSGDRDQEKMGWGGKKIAHLLGGKVKAPNTWLQKSCRRFGLTQGRWSCTHSTVQQRCTNRVSMDVWSGVNLTSHLITKVHVWSLQNNIWISQSHFTKGCFEQMKFKLSSSATITQSVLGEKKKIWWKETPCHLLSMEVEIFCLGNGNTVRIEDRMDGTKYLQILDVYALKSVKIVKLKRGWPLQQDSYP